MKSIIKCLALIIILSEKSQETLGPEDEENLKHNFISESGILIILSERIYVIPYLSEKGIELSIQPTKPPLKLYLKVTMLFFILLKPNCSYQSKLAELIFR